MIESKGMPPMLRDHVLRKLKEGERMDGRALDEFREISIETGLISQAEGSAVVRLGKTLAYLGVKIGIGTPFPDQGNTGILMTNLELRPIAHVQFEQGPPRPNAIEVSRVVDRGIREGKVIDLTKLVIEPGEKVWMCNLDGIVADYDGNLFDAAQLGLMAALNQANVPASKFDLGEDFPLPIQGAVASTTVVKIGDHLLVDPTAAEELLADARLTISVDTNGDVRAMQKGKSGSLRQEDVVEALKYAIRYAEKHLPLVRG